MSTLPDVGELFEGRFRLEHSIGKGGFGLVFRAVDVTTNQPVAVKVLKPDRPDGYDPRTTARFVREATILHQLEHDHIIDMYGHGVSESGLLYMVFEWLDGVDLSTYLRDRGRLPPDVVVAILTQLFGALQAAHRRGLLHRDIKPDNIRVLDARSTVPTVKLLNFGLARAVEEGGPGITKTGEVIGTPRYMAPEQILEGKLTPASDIYSLGVVALELLMGPDALPGNKWGDQFDRLVTGHVFAIPDVERIGPHLVGVVQRMTARAPGDRYQDVAAVVRALGGPTDTAGTSIDPPAPTANSPLRLRVAAFAVVAVVAVVAGLLAYAALSESPHPTDSSRTERSRVNPLAASRGPSAPVDVPAPDMATTASLDQGAPSRCAAPFEGVGELTDDPLSPTDRWLTYIPRGFDPEGKHPLVVFLHETGKPAETVVNLSNLKPAADTYGFVVIAPSDLIVAPWMEDSDTNRVQRLINETTRQLCLDESRVFLVNHGTGGKVVDALSCSGSVAATANFAHGRISPHLPCDTPNPHMVVAPTESRWEPIDGGLNCYDEPIISLAETTRIWRERNKCDKDSPAVVRSKDMTCRTWSCGQPLRVCERKGGRPWPRTGGRTLDFGRCDGPNNPTPLFDPIFEFFDGLEPKRAIDGE